MGLEKAKEDNIFDQFLRPELSSVELTESTITYSRGTQSISKNMPPEDIMMEAEKEYHVANFLSLDAYLTYRSEGNVTILLKKNDINWYISLFGGLTPGKFMFIASQSN